MTTWLLVPVLRQWRSRRPDVTLDLSEFTSADAMEEVIADGRTDLAVGPRPTRTDLHVSVLGQEEMVVVAAAGHRFAELSSVPVAELAQEWFVHYDPSNGLASWVDQLAAQHAIVLNPVLRTRSPRTAAQLGGAGMGVTIVPTSALTPRSAGIVRRLRPMIKRDVVVITGAPSDTLAQNFLGDLRRRKLPAWIGPS
jgi:DNA-binding transcriptional LysR family regulator